MARVKYDPDQEMFSTGQVAAILGVAPRTAAKWMDSSHLVSHRLYGNKERRVSRDALIYFMEKNGFPLKEFTRDHRTVVLAYGLPASEQLKLAELDPSHYALSVADSLFHAGMILGELSPRVLILDLAAGRRDCLSAALVARSRPLRPRQILALACEDENDSRSLVHAGFTDVLVRPFDFTSVLRLIEEGVKCRSRTCEVLPTPSSAAPASATPTPPSGT